MKQIITLTVLPLICSTLALVPCSAQDQPPQALPVAPGNPPKPPRAPTTPPKSSAGFSQRLQSIVNRAPSAEPAGPLVLQFSGADDKALRSLDEDLAVMSRLLEKAVEQSVGEDLPPDKMGIRLWALHPSRQVRALYLDGFGALFLLQANIPLLGTPAEKKEAEPRPSSEWEKARREVYGMSEDHGGNPAPYDPAQVQALKKTMVEALKNASHIRQLKADDYVAVTVFGASANRPGPAGLGRRSSGREASGGYGGGMGGSGSGGYGGGGFAFSTNPGSENGTVMTLRARKSDIDAFAGGDLDSDAFLKKITSSTYIGAGCGPTGNTFVLQHSLDALRQTHDELKMR